MLMLSVLQKQRLSPFGLSLCLLCGKVCLLSLCFFCGSFGCRSLFCYRCLGRRRLLAAASAGCLLLGLSHVFVEVNELDEAHFGSVARTETSLDDASVATGTVEHLYANFAEKFGNGDLVLKLAEHYATRIHRVLLALGDEGLNVLLQCLSLGQSRSDSFVLNQRASHVGKHRSSVRSSTAQMIKFLIVSHFGF